MNTQHIQRAIDFTAQVAKEQLAALEADNATLRAALEELTNMFPEDMRDDGSGRWGWLPEAIDTVRRARAALNETGE